MINFRFTIKKKLGEGRSKVFLCSDNENPEKDFALKILPDTADPHEIKLFKNEFFTLQKLNHPNIISCIDEGVIVKTENEEGINQGSRFILIEYFPGLPLLDYNKTKTEETLNKLLEQICSVLFYLHQANYIYYDLKPENILVDDSGEIPFLKLIDMGFAHNILSSAEYSARGTKEYISPEILKKDPHNYKTDLYSLGIVLYRIIYDKFPFASKEELDIYKEHIESDFSFPENKYSIELTGIVKKLLEKNPVERFDTSLHILKNIKADINRDYIKYFIPASVFVGRKKILSEIENYLAEKSKIEILVITGSEGSGKTALVNKIYSTYDKIIFIRGKSGKSGVAFIQHLLRKIIFSEYVFPFLTNSIIDDSLAIISGATGNLTDSLKSIFVKITEKAKHTIIIDDFNLLDEFSLDILREIIPIFLVNDIKIILTERNDDPDVSEKLMNKTKNLSLVPFTGEELDLYIDQAFAGFFPKDQLNKLILLHSDLLPGSIINFIRDLILLDILKFSFDGPEIIVDEKNRQLLEGTHDEIFRLRFSLLSNDEIKISRFLTSFEKTPDVEIISSFHDFSNEAVNTIYKSLGEKNILQVSSLGNSIDFTSESLKKFIYSTIDDKDNYHSQIAKFISNHFEEFNRIELSRHFELSKDFISSYDLLIREIDEADKLSAFSYKKNLLDHLLQLQLPENYLVELKYKLTETLYRLNDSKSALVLAEELIKNAKDEKIKNDLSAIKGNCLIEIGEIEEGKNLLSELIKKTDDDGLKQKALIEIAHAEFDLGNYEVAKIICLGIINNDNSTFEERGKCYNLLGLIDTYRDNNFDNALTNFQKGLEMYKEAKLVLNEAKIEVNIGNSYNRNEDYTNAEIHWTNALQKNLSVGNIDQEAKILLNFGIFNYTLGNFDKAIEQYLRAYNIFFSLGNRYGQGITLTNLGEISISMCEYQSALNYLNNAKENFKQLSNPEEDAEINFLLCKLYYLIGFEEQLKNTLHEYNSLIEKKSLPKRFICNYEVLLIISASERNSNELEINKTIASYTDQNEGVFFAEGLIMLAERLIHDERYDLALNILNKNKLEKLSVNNVLINAERKYLLGLLSIKNNSPELLPANQILEEAYNLVNEEHIFEVTWKILFALGENYFYRGSIKKANDYLFSAKEIIKFIAGNIKDDSIKLKYLSKPVRKSVLEQTEKMISK